MGYQLNIKINEELKRDNYWNDERIANEKDEITKKLILFATIDWNVDSMSKLMNFVSMNLKMLDSVIERDFNNWIYDIQNKDSQTIWFSGWEISSYDKVEEEMKLSKSLYNDNYTELLITSFTPYERLIDSEDGWEFAEFYRVKISNIISSYVDNYFEYLKYKWIYEHYNDVIDNG